MVSHTQTTSVDPGQPEQQAATGGPDPSGSEDLRSLGQSFAELKEYISYYLSARRDSLKLSVRTVALYAILGLVGLIAGSGLIITAVVLALTGLAGLVNALINIGGHAQNAGLVPALGYATVGVLVLGGIGLCAWWFTRRLFSASRRKTVEKYEKRRRQQTLEHGTDVHARARAG